MSSSPPPPATYSQGPSQSFSQSLPTRNHSIHSRKSTQRCESCRSRKLFIQDGRLWCRRCGSLQEDFIQTQAEDDFTKLRSSQVTRQKKEIVEKAKKTLSGTKALYLYLSTYQLILQHLCRALIDVKGLPSTLEVLVKDLWELRMKLIRERYLATRPQHGDDDEVDEQSDTTMYSSQTETEYTQTDTEGDTTERSVKIRKERDFPNIVDMLALCYMSCMILRIPLSVGNLFRWATREEIPFLRPLRLVPSDMQHGLGSRWSPFLQTRAPLQLSKLYSSIHDLHSLYYRHFSIQLPPLNYHPLLHHYITSLNLPIDLFPAITHLSTTLFTHPFSFPKPRRRTTYLTHPEVQLISMLVIAIKLFHPFPTNSHNNKNSSLCPTPQLPPGVGLSLGIIPINWPLWLSVHQPQPNSHSKEASASEFKPGEQIHITAPQVLHLSPERIDGYMDWYEKTWLDREPRSQVREGSGLEADDGTEGDLNGDSDGEGGGRGGGVMSAVRGMFRPFRDSTTQPPSPHDQGQGLEEEEEDDDDMDILEKMRTIYSFPKPSSSSSSSSSTHTPGKNYKRYRNISDLSNTSSPHDEAVAARIFHEVLSHTAALSLSDLTKAIYTHERKLIKKYPSERNLTNTQHYHQAHETP